MAHPNKKNWLLEPVIPAPPALPRLDHETQALVDAEEINALHPSGTWLVGTRPQAEATHDDDARFATSDAEAPTVRPGSLRAALKR